MIQPGSTASGAQDQSQATAVTPIQLYAKRSGASSGATHAAASSALHTGSAAATGMSVDVPDDVDFTIQITKEMDPKRVKVGDLVHARLVEDLFVDLKKVASAGDEVLGTVTKVVDGKRTIKSYVPTKHWLNSQGRLTVAFNEIVTPAQRHLAINARPIPYTYIDRANPTRVEYLVNKDGELTVHYAVMKYLAWDALINTCVIAAGGYGMIAAPAVTGAVGVMCPEYAQGHPVDPAETQSRARNFMLGAGRGANGGWLIYGMSTKGLNIGLQQGDKLEVRIKSGRQISLDVAATAAAAASAPKAVASVHAERVPK